MAGMVYVRWYGKVLEGELLDGDQMGMKQVRIPLDGRHPVALFTPGHVYDTRSHPDLMESDQRPARKETLETRRPSPSDVLPANDRQMLEAFKRDHWDHEHNHLRIDALDEFYRLWRMAITPFGFSETKPRYVVGVDPGDPRGDVSVMLPLKPPPPPVHHKQRPKDVIRKNIVQLELF